MGQFLKVFCLQKERKIFNECLKQRGHLFLFAFIFHIMDQLTPGKVFCQDINKRFRFRPVITRGDLNQNN